MRPPSRPTPTRPRLLRELVDALGIRRQPIGSWLADGSCRSSSTVARPSTSDTPEPTPIGRSILSLVSVCGPANDRDARILLKLNARTVEGHFAIRVLRGEEYFVVIENMPAEAVEVIDPAGLVRRIAETADGLEDRLSRGRDLY